MKYPTNIKGYIKLFWNYLKMGSIEKCERILHIAELNIRKGIIKLEGKDQETL